MRGDLLLSFLFLSCTALLLFSVRETEASRKEYRTLIQPPLEAAKGTERQRRTDVRKDLFIVQEKERLHALITAPSSDLVLTHQGGNPRVVEEFGAFEGKMQEALFFDPPQQLLRVFSGQRGTFSFAEEKLAAEEVLLARYLFPGRELPSEIRGVKPEMKGVAESAELTFGEGFHFTARHVKATFMLPEKKR